MTGYPVWSASGIRFAVILLISLIGCIETANAQLAGYSFRKQITILNGQVSGSADHANFPVLISHTDTDLRTFPNGGNVMNSNGYDIVFTAADGVTQLDHQLEKYTASTGAVVAWVRIPLLDFNDDTNIYMYYGNTSISTDQSSTGTWDSNYTAVWHMSDDPSGTAPQIPDATSTTNDGTANNMEAGDLVTGQLGDALSFDGVNEYIDVDTLGNFGSNLSEATFQFWINTTQATIFSAMGFLNTSNNTAILCELNSVRPFGSESTGDTRFFVRDSSSPTVQQRSGSDITGFNDGGWHQITYVKRTGNGAIDIYFDGVATSVSVDNKDPNTFSNLQHSMVLGARNNRNTIDHFGNCSLDEVRISDIARSADWLTTEYNNQSSPGTFYNLGASETMIGPGSITANLALWLKADQAVDGSPITTWGDFSGNAYHATQAGTGDYATLSSEVHNFNPAVYFTNGDNGYFEANLDEIKGSSYNLIAVVERDNSNSDNYLLGTSCSGCTANQGLHFGYQTNTAARLSHYGNNLNVTVNAFDSPETSVALLRGELNTASGKTVYELRDGTAVSNTDANTATVAGITGHVGKGFAGSRGFEGYVSEIVAFSSTLSATDLSKIYSYLAIKYGFTLASGEDYIASDGTVLWNATTNSGYHRDVAGIGRDDESLLSQTKSLSTSSDAMIIMDKGSTFTNDLDFIVWGNDNGTASFSTTNPHPDYNSILGRNWKVAVNGTPGSVTLRVILPNNGNAAEHALHVDTDINFTSGATTYVASSVSGDTLTFDNVSLSNNNYFTLGKDSGYPGGVSTNLTLWLRADYGLKNGGVEVSSGAIDEWENYAVNANFSEVTVNNDNPTLVANDKSYQPAVYFDGVDDNLMKANVDADVLFSDQNNTVFYVVRRFPKVATEVLAGWENVGAGQRMGYFENRSVGTMRTDVVSSSVGGTTVIENDNALIVTYNDATTIDIYVNGVIEGTTGPVTMTAAGNTGDFTLGCRPVLNAYTQNYTSEYIVFNTSLSATEIAKVQSYLAMKYSITMNDSGGGTAGDYLASDGTTIWDASESPTYNNQVVALGRDDISSLYIKQSKNESDSLIAWVDNLAADNNANTGTITNDISYVVMGHDGGLKRATGSSTEMPTGIKSRFDREWKITNTNFSDAFHLEFEWDSAGSFDINDVRLLVDSDGDFSNALVFGPADGLTFSVGSIIVEGITTAHVPMNTTSYVTLGSVSLGTTLPIELVGFEADVVEEGRSVKLEWSTASEDDNDYFTIERSPDNVQWDPIIMLPGAGDSNELLDYQAYDDAPLYGLSYYRLKQTDFDGQYSHSDIRQVTIGDFDETLTVYPNPTGDVLYVKGNPEDLAALQILNITGQVVRDRVPAILKSATQLQVDVSALEAGIYTLRTASGAVNFIKR